MRKLLLVFILLSPIHGVFSADCYSVASIGESERFDCRHSETNKVFHVLRLKGSFEQISYEHAYLLSEEASKGVLKETLDRFNKSLNEGSLLEREIQGAIVSCLEDQIWDSTTAEFKRGVQFFHAGLKDAYERRSLKSPYGFSEIRTASTGIELSIAADGLTRRMEESPLEAYADLALSCGLRVAQYGIENVLRAVGGGLFRMKLGCLGFSVPEADSLENGMIHARNLDANLVKSWNTAPTFFLMEEPGQYKYVAAATAGMFYPGGISGMNEKGISVSLHEMSTTAYRTQHRRGTASVAPFLQQRILREASTLNEAIQILKTSGRFGAWTILVSDNKTNETASIEFTGKKISVARRVQGQAMAQSNHFLSPQMKGQAYSYSYNKIFESRSRLQGTERRLSEDRGRIDLEWAINQLSGHWDIYEGFRSFGRTSVKAYNVMSTVALPGRNEFWMSIGDRLPAAHSFFVGFEIDWENFEFRELESFRTRQYENLPNWENSLSEFVRAKSFYQDGQFSDSLSQVNAAIRLSKEDQIDELPYFYIRARLLLEMNQIESAYQEFGRVWAQRKELHDYGQALSGLYYAHTINLRMKGKATDFKKAMRQKRNHILSESEALLKVLKKKDDHFDLRQKIKWISSLRSEKKIQIPSIDFVTIE